MGWGDVPPDGGNAFIISGDGHGKSSVRPGVISASVVKSLRQALRCLKKGGRCRLYVFSWPPQRAFYTIRATRSIKQVADILPGDIRELET